MRAEVLIALRGESSARRYVEAPFLASITGAPIGPRWTISMPHAVSPLQHSAWFTPAMGQPVCTHAA